MKLSTIAIAGLVSQATAATVKVMPFGASIVTGCWRANLYKLLQDAKITNFDFVGSQVGGDCGFPYDKEHEGHPGAQITDIASQNQLPPWLSAVKPDVVLMHIGTNDILLGNKPVADIMKAYTTVLDQMRASKPTMKVIISQLIPLDVKKFGQDKANGIIALNKEIVKWGQNRPVTIVDNFTGFNTTIDTTDGEHPNTQGNTKFAKVFFPPTAEAIRSVGGRTRP